MPASITTELIDEVRRLVGDPAGASQVWEDDDIEDALNNWRTEIRYAPLNAQPTIAAGGVVSYLDYYAGIGMWGGDDVLVDGSYNTLTPSATDRRRGRWSFAESTLPPVYVVGGYYDVHSAAAEIVEQWIGKVKLDYAFSADGASFSRNQQLDGLKALLSSLQSKAGVTVMRMVRSDAA